MRFATLLVVFSPVLAIPDWTALLPDDLEERIDETDDLIEDKNETEVEFRFGAFFDFWQGNPPTGAPTVTMQPTGVPSATPTTSAPVTPAPVTPAPVTPAPVTPAPVATTPAPATPGPIDARVETPSPTDSTTSPTDSTTSPTDSPTLGEHTRTASYQYQWGGVTNGCRYSAPRSLVKCMSGGVLSIINVSNADCQMLATDIAKCSQVDEDDDAIVDFQCSGTTDWTLAANVRTMPSEAQDCQAFDGTGYGGDAVAAGSLGRYCFDSNMNSTTLVDDYACVEGLAGEQGGDRFCASAKSCRGVDCIIEIDPFSITAYDEDPQCSSVENELDLVDVELVPSTLTSFHTVIWTYSDLGFGCDWVVPDIEIKCNDGGLIEAVRDLEFCNNVGNVVTCTDPDPASEDGRITHQLEFFCYGNRPEQLVLAATTQEMDVTRSMCLPDGIVVHGIDIARGCGGAPDSPGFTRFETPQFCSDMRQFHQDLCFAGFACPQGIDGFDDCFDIPLPRVEVDTSDLVVGSCFYAR